MPLSYRIVAFWIRFTKRIERIKENPQEATINSYLGLMRHGTGFILLVK